MTKENTERYQVMHAGMFVVESRIRRKAVIKSGVRDAIKQIDAMTHCERQETCRQRGSREGPASHLSDSFNCSFNSPIMN